MSRFVSQDRGFKMTFANGWTVSVQWGIGAYGDGETAEIAAWDSKDRWLDFGTDEVKGWVRTDEVADFISFVASLPRHGGRSKLDEYDRELAYAENVDPNTL